MTQNKGLLVDPRERVRVAGIIGYTVRNPDGDWTKWLPDGEKQSNGIDTMACVSFSLLNCIETQEYFLTGKQVNYSDRWLAKISGTTKQGNYLVSVAEAVNQYGLVREESWLPPDLDNYTWEQYYAEPGPAKHKELLAEGQEWLKTHKFQYEWLTTDRDEILKQLKQCPLQVCIPGHAIMNFYSYVDVIHFFDSYDPFWKETQRINLTNVFKPLLTIKKMRFVNDKGTVWLVGDKGKIGFTDMQALQKMQQIDSSEVEQGSTEGIPVVGLFESGLTFHN